MRLKPRLIKEEGLAVAYKTAMSEKRPFPVTGDEIPATEEPTPAPVEPKKEEFRVRSTYNPWAQYTSSPSVTVVSNSPQFSYVSYVPGYGWALFST